jgi:hypothetical protein
LLFGNFVIGRRQSLWSKRLLTMRESPFLGARK